MSEDADAFWREAEARAGVMRKLVEVLERIPPGAVDVELSAVDVIDADFSAQLRFMRSPGDG